MSILINMEMPKNCGECKLRNGIGKDCGKAIFYCAPLVKWVVPTPLGRADDCPLIELPPHGRLIDADAMIVSVKRQTDFLRNIGGDLAVTAEVLEKGILQEIKNAPTIIEAEGE